jgi:hypothetical protein
VVRGEEHDQNLTASIIGKFVVLTVNPRKIELRRRIADLERTDVRRVAVDEPVLGAEAQASAKTHTKDEEEGEEVSHR